MHQLGDLVGVLLAGGLSRRMGQDKALLELHGRSLLQFQINLLSPLCSTVIVSGDYPGFTCVPDTVARCGPIGGIYSVAMQFPDSALLIIPVDMLGLTHKHLAQLSQCVYACHFANQPLPAFFPSSKQVVTVIQQLFAEPKPDFSIRYLHSALSSKSLVDSSFAPSNINTPADWQNFTQNNYK